MDQNEPGVTELHIYARELCRQHCGHHSSEGIQLVQPGSPELAERWVRYGYSTHVRKNDLNWRREEGSDLDTWRNGCDELTEGYGEKFRDQDDKELESSATRPGRSLAEVDRKYLTNASLIVGIGRQQGTDQQCPEYNRT